MPTNLRSSLGTIWITLIIALMLSVLGTPAMDIASGARLAPEWLALVLIYWALTTPQQVGLFTAWVFGLILDLISGTLIGEHAIGLLVIVYITQRFYLPLRGYPIAQQMLAIMGFLAVYELQLLWIDGITGERATTLWRLLPAVIGAITWPLISWLLGLLAYRTEED